MARHRRRTARRRRTGASGHELDIERGSDVPISTQIYWQLAYQIESGRLQPGTRLPPVRELGRRAARQPQHRARGLPPPRRRGLRRRPARGRDAGRRPAAGPTRFGRPGRDRRGDAAPRGQLGFTPDEVAQATFTAASEHRRPGPLVRVLFAECTSADAMFDAERIIEAFPDRIEAMGVLLEELPERLERYHYDLVATTTFHADEAQAYVGGAVPVVAMLVGPGYMSLVHEVAGLPPGSKVGLVCGSQRGVENIAEVLALAGATGVEIVSAVAHTEAELELVDRDADIVLLSREAMALGLDSRFERPERVREWSYEFDPAGLELLRRAIERVDAAREHVPQA